MALLRCFTCIRVNQKRKPESYIALLVQGDEDDHDDDDEYHTSKIRLRRLSWDDKGPERAVAGHRNGDEDHDHVDGEYYTSRTGVRRFTWDEIDRLKGYSNLDMDVGYGGFTMVYTARLPNSTAVAMKFYKGKGLRTYEHVLEILFLLQHDNIVKLLGYCDDQEKGVLVLEHIANTTLRDKLCGIGETSGPGMESGVLSWKSRMKIAYQLIQAIEYLHEKCPQQIIHGDIKPSNVLLDEQLDCKLWNFESAKMGTQDGSSPSKGLFVLDYPGYTDFHYLSTGIALKQHDIYSFGIIVLELLTGIEAPWLHSRGSVASQADSMLRDKATLVKMLDSQLGGDFDLEEAMTMASISAMCLHNSPALRPSASDVVQEMRSGIHSINLNQQN